MLKLVHDSLLRSDRQSNRRIRFSDLCYVDQRHSKELSEDLLTRNLPVLVGTAGDRGCLASFAEAPHHTSRSIGPFVESGTFLEWPTHQLKSDRLPVENNRFVCAALTGRADHEFYGYIYTITVGALGNRLLYTFASRPLNVRLMSATPSEAEKQRTSQNSGIPGSGNGASGIAISCIE